MKKVELDKLLNRIAGDLAIARTRAPQAVQRIEVDLALIMANVKLVKPEAETKPKSKARSNK